MTVTEFKFFDGGMPENHGEQKFPVENGYLKNDYGYEELSMNDLRNLRNEEWARIKADESSEYPDRVFYQSSLLSAVNQEIATRRTWKRETSPPASSEIDKTYVYPGDEPPPGKKWVLVDDDSPGLIAYVVKE
jgi:hypothetical protein